MYQISNKGNVKSLKRMVVRNNNRPLLVEEKIMKLSLDQKGYLFVALSKNDVRKFYRVHRLVAQAFISNPNNLPQVNHKDEDKTHNWISNLEWCDAKYNSNFGTRKERLSKKFGKRVYCEELDKIFDSIAEAARELNISRSHICEVCKGIHSHTHSYHFRYMEEEQ